MMPAVKSGRGFTLIELLVTVLIVGILAAVSLGAYNGQRNKAKNAQAQSAIRDALGAAHSYWTANESYVGLAAGILVEEPTLLPNTPDQMWPTTGTPDTRMPGGALVDPRRMRVHVYSGVNGGDGQCISIGNLSTGDMAYMIMDCKETKDIWTGSAWVTFQKGTYYGSARNTTLNVANSEIMSEWRTSWFDND